MMSLSQPSSLTIDFGAAHDRASGVYQRNALLKEKSTELDKYLSMLKGSCPVEFARGYILTPRHGRLLLECGVLDVPNTWLRFKKSIKFRPFAYCYRCGMPLGVFEPSCHKHVVKATGMSCPWDDFMVSVVHTLWHTPKTRLQIMAVFELRKGLREDEPFGDDEFVVWARTEEEQTGRFINCLEVFIWYCRSWSASRCSGQYLLLLPSMFCYTYLPVIVSLRLAVVVSTIVPISYICGLYICAVKQGKKNVYIVM